MPYNRLYDLSNKELTMMIFEFAKQLSKTEGLKLGYTGELEEDLQDALSISFAPIVGRISTAAITSDSKCEKINVSQLAFLPHVRAEEQRRRQEKIYGSQLAFLTLSLSSVCCQLKKEGTDFNPLSLAANILTCSHPDYLLGRRSSDILSKSNLECAKSICATYAKAIADGYKFEYCITKCGMAYMCSDPGNASQLAMYISSYCFAPLLASIH